MCFTMTPSSEDPAPQLKRQRTRSVTRRTESAFALVPFRTTELIDRQARAEVTAAFKRKEPLVLRCTLSETDKRGLRAEWEAFVAASTTKHQTKDHGANITLRQAWQSPIRIETGLRKDGSDEKSEHNPVRMFLETAKQGSMANQMWGRQVRLETLARGLARACDNVVYPSFIAGNINPGGGPTHQDDYDNFAMVLVGCKTFYTASHDHFVSFPVRGSKDGNERRGVNPFDDASLNDGENLDPAPLHYWQRAQLYPGDMLFLPQGYWHWVQSVPHTVMTNTWI